MRELTLKAQKQALETRQTELFLQFYEKYSNIRKERMEILEIWNWTDYDDFMKKYGPDDNHEAWKNYVYIFSLFEQMGILAKEGSINLQLLYDWIAGEPIRLWDKFEPIVDAYRIEAEPSPKGQWMEYFEDLVYMLREIREKDIRDLDNRLKKRKLRRQELGRTMPEYQ